MKVVHFNCAAHELEERLAAEANVWVKDCNCCAGRGHYLTVESMDIDHYTAQVSVPYEGHSSGHALTDESRCRVVLVLR